MGKRILKLLDLSVLIKVVFLYFAVFVLWQGLLQYAKNETWLYDRNNKEVVDIRNSS